MSSITFSCGNLPAILFSLNFLFKSQNKCVDIICYPLRSINSVIYIYIYNVSRVFFLRPPPSPHLLFCIPTQFELKIFEYPNLRGLPFLIYYFLLCFIKKSIQNNVFDLSGNFKLIIWYVQFFKKLNAILCINIFVYDLSWPHL